MELTCVIASINFVPDTLSFEIYVLFWGKENLLSSWRRMALLTFVFEKVHEAHYKYYGKEIVYSTQPKYNFWLKWCAVWPCNSVLSKDIVLFLAKVQ